MKRTHIALLAAAAFSAPSSAAVIPGLFNTGTDANNFALVGPDGTIDPHYQIVASSIPAFVGQQARTFIAGTYLPNDANSRWISPTGGGGLSFSTWVYRLSFDLSGFDHTAASITGRFGSDNTGAIFLNGQDTGITAINQFIALTAFTLDSGFVAGVNTLDFRVQDFGGPTALRVDDLAGTISAPNAIPEPATWAMMIAGFAMAGAAARRHRTAVLA